MKRYGNFVEVVAIEISRIDGSELVELSVQHIQDKLNMVITVRTTKLLRYEQVTALQKSIAPRLPACKPSMPHCRN